MRQLCDSVRSQRCKPRLASGQKPTSLISFLCQGCPPSNGTIDLRLPGIIRDESLAVRHIEPLLVAYCHTRFLYRTALRRRGRGFESRRMRQIEKAPGLIAWSLFVCLVKTFLRLQGIRRHSSGRSSFLPCKDKPPTCVSGSGVWDRSLTMTYSHMGKPHTTIGDASFHY